MNATGRSVELFELGVQRESEGRLHDARRAYESCLQTEPDHAPALLRLGQLALRAGKPRDAVSYLQRSLAVDPKVDGGHAVLAPALHLLGRVQEAASHYRSALTRAPGDAGLNNAYGACLHQLGEMEQAATQFRRAIELAPQDPSAYNNLGSVMHEMGRPDQAAEQYQRALNLEPDQAAVHANLGIVAKELWHMDDAIRHLTRAVELQPEFAKAHANLAVALHATNRLEEAKDAATQALRLEPGNPLATIVAASLDRHAGRLDEAASRLEKLAATRPPDDAVASMQHELACVYDRKGDYEKAFTAFQVSNHARSEPAIKHGMDGRYSLSIIDRMMKLLTPGVTQDWPRQVPDDGLPTPGFLVGFPRSGTTLLEQVLASHPRVATLSERPALDTARKKLDQTGRNYPTDLAGLSSEAVGAMRRAYWDVVTQELGGQQLEKLVIDKNPLNIVHLALVYRLFPGAPVIFALRDPRDVCLSCFMQDFQLNSAMIHFCTMEGTAAFYNRVMQLWDRTRSIVPLRYMYTRYESIVDDFEAEARRVLDFLDLQWSPDVLDYAATAKERQILTPSYDQVVRPIYTSSIGRWRNYRNEMAEALTVLAPYLVEFGYEQAKNHSD